MEIKQHSLKPTAERKTRKIRKYFELNGNKIKTYKTSSNYFKKEEKSLFKKINLILKISKKEK